MSWKSFAVISCFLFSHTVRNNGSSSKGGYLHNSILKMDVSQPETTANQTTITKQSPDLTWSRIGSYIKILGSSAHKQVTDTPSNKISYKAMSMKSV